MLSSDFLIIVAKLDHYIIAFLQPAHHGIPAMLINKAFGTSAIYCMILYSYFIGKIAGKQLSPATFRMLSSGLLAMVLSPIKKMVTFLRWHKSETAYNNQ